MTATTVAVSSLARVCAGCDRPISNRRSRPPGVLRHAARGCCSTCYHHQATQVQPATPPEPEASPAPQRVGAAGPTFGDLDFARHAACRGLTPQQQRMFEPPPATPVGELSTGVPHGAVVAARRWCGRCPVLTECERFAFRYRKEGLWGGQWWAPSGRVVDITTKTMAGAA